MSEVVFELALRRVPRAPFIYKTIFVFDRQIILLHTQLTGFSKLNRQSPTIVNFLLLLHRGIVDPDRMIRHSVRHAVKGLIQKEKNTNGRSYYFNIHR
jgi:hypothetical protein